MTLFAVGIFVMAAFVAAFLVYGRYLARAFALKSTPTTPAVKLNDGVDYVPTRPAILVGQHFTAIAAVGPIVGPIAAGCVHGWGPGIIWIVLGAVFIGAVHDFASLVASVRHGAKSVAEVIRLYIGRRSYLMFLGFVWLSLQYITVVFVDLTSNAFVAPGHGPGVASSSFAYLGLAILMGVALTRWRMPLWLATVVFLPLVGVAIWGGQSVPVSLSKGSWNYVILGYCFVASIAPLTLLLQPRGYLGAYFMYSTFAAGAIGSLIAGMHVEYPVRLPTMLFGFDASTLQVVFPVMFTTIACGACSGFHGLVSSGTTSKQLRTERDAVAVGYGGMLLEGFLAFVAMSTVMILSVSDPLVKTSPDQVYAHGLARFLGFFGVDREFALAFGTLAFATFIYDTLDVATRLGRYIVQEFTGWKGRRGMLAATVATLLLPALAVGMKVTDSAGNPAPLWKLFWPAFGASNQLLAALTLAGLTLWLKKEKRNHWITGIPAVFMAGMTLWSLSLIIGSRGVLDAVTGYPDPVGAPAVVLFGLAVYILLAATRIIPKQYA